MAWVIEALNPFEPLKIEKHHVSGTVTVRDWVSSRYVQTKEFPTPTICLFNGKPVLREDWENTFITERDVVSFVAVQGIELGAAFVLSAIFIIGSISLSIALYLLTPVPDVPGDAAASDPVYSIKGQANSIRLGEPIECGYGTNRIFPSYASRPYLEYANNEQYQHSLFCLGQGQYEIHAVQIGDSLIDSFEEADYEVVPPGSSVTLFPTNVFTSAEAGGQNLYGANQAQYVGDGWVGPFIANPAGTSAIQLQIDLIYPKGLYIMNEKGFPAPMSVLTEAQRRLIDSSGAPLGAWEFFGATQYETAWGQTTTPIRRTFSAAVPAGRYEVRVRRADNFFDWARVGNDVVWEGLRSWLDIEHDFGDVTLLAVKIRATNNLNDRTTQRFNVIATRKLPIRNSLGVWSEPVATRSIVWAFVDVFRSQYGGRISSDVFFDWEALLALDAVYTSRSEYFDWVFRDPIVCWEAAKTIAAAGRAIPLLSGSMITMKRDGPLSVPVAMFNQENIEGSFEWQTKLWDLDEHDSIRVEYTEVSTGYKQETVMCVLPGDTSDHPQDVRLMGIQDRAHAYHEGMYRLAVMRYLRENVVFTTGLEGYIPTYGDLIAISHDVPNWGQGGYVVNAVRGGGDMYHLWLSEPLVWEVGITYQILLRSKTGDVLGPFTAHQPSDDRQVAIETSQTIDFLLSGKTEPMLFLFGPVGNVTKTMKVLRIEPQGGERVKITAVNENSTVHSFDSLVPAGLREDIYAPIPPDLPVVTNLYITPIDGSLMVVQIAWTAAFGAESYIVQTSNDGVDWTQRARVTQTAVQLQVQLGALYVRVAAIGVGQGPWIQDNVVLGPLNGLGNAVPWAFLDWAVSWFAALSSQGYEVKVYNNSGASPVLKRTTQLTVAEERLFSYDYATAVLDSNVTREMLVTVDVLYSAESGGGLEASGVPTELELSNTVPTPVTGLGSAVNAVNPVTIDYLLSWTVPALDDLIRIKVWLSPTDGFDPSVEVPVYDFTAASPGSAGIPVSRIEAVPLDSFDAHPVYYWRVGLFDVWGNEISTNVSAQQTILAYP